LDLDVEKIFIATEQYPADDLGAQLGCRRDAGGHIVVDPHYHTSVYNVFAAGDIVPGSQLAIAAAADGAIAALSIHKSLVPNSRKLEPVK
jgi:thioredoxin reductase